MERFVEKVTALITRDAGAGPELLLFQHPYAGVQIPAGTVQAGEAPEVAVVREAAEETGLSPFSAPCYLGSEDWRPEAGQALIAERTTVYARPDTGSFDWAYLPRSALVRIERRASGFHQVTYEEFDRVPDPGYVTMCICGWVPDGVLAGAAKRYYYHLAYEGPRRARWTVRTDNHTFSLFWASLADLPAIIPPQDAWPAFLDEVCH
ncbi:MAG: NUDIX domain-containing protein [Anaerolineae bacterium]|jgi:8-oxo-dGTP pyrophosphatase MutT (NUDIX family)